MSDKSKIQWTDATWNPVVGCSKVSAGCANCYAETAAASGRLQQFEKYKKVITGKKWNGTAWLDEKTLQKPLHWRDPKMIFVNSMGDLFHPQVPVERIQSVREVIDKCPQHIFQILTKRPENIKEYTIRFGDFGPNVWLGVTAENQEMADKRIPVLLSIPAAVRFVSIEPMLGDIKIERFLPHYASSVARKEIIGGSDLDWVIVGCETGSGARRCYLRDVKHVVDQCRDSEPPVFVKQVPVPAKACRMTPEPPLYAWDEMIGQFGWRVSDVMAEWPEALRRREFPKAKI